MKPAALIIMAIVGFILICVSACLLVDSIKKRKWYDVIVSSFGILLNGLITYVAIWCCL